MEKNRDTLNEYISSLLRNSKNEYISKCFPKTDKNKTNEKHSILSKFQLSLTKLMNDINKTESYFICCIKPNNQRKPLLIQGSKVVNQLKHSGIFEWIQLRNGAFAYRLTPKQFFEKLRVILLCCYLKIQKNIFYLNTAMVEY